MPSLKSVVPDMLVAEPGGPLSFSKRVSELLKVCLFQPALCVLCSSRLLCCGD